jgi:serine 3-dehydrogenase
MKDVAMPTAIITGATSGIGEAAVRIFAGAGWNVIATGRRAERLEALRASATGGAVLPAVFDVRDEKARDAMLDNRPNGFDKIDLLINNAGLALGTGPAQSIGVQDWKTMIDTNVTALASFTHRLLPELIETRGAIINMSSTAAYYPYPGGNVYAGTKAFVSQFGLDLRSDLHATGVRVTAIEAGMVETEFTRIRTGGNQEASDKLYEGSQPLTADDIAKTMLWIATLPPHVNINKLELMPVSQSWGPFQVARGGRS